MENTGIIQNSTIFATTLKFDYLWCRSQRFLTFTLLQFLTISLNQSVSMLCSQNFKKMSLIGMETGAIIGGGDRKRAPFLVLGLAPWCGTIFLFLEQIAPSPAAHARTCCEDFLRMSRRGNGIRDSRNLCFWPTTQHVYVRWNLP